MDIKQLEFFSVACEKGSLSQAAACLYTSQPHISKTIRTLEKELGRPLLSRSGKGVRPTIYGETVLEYANLILKAAGTISSLSLPDSHKSLRLSTYPSHMISRLLLEKMQIRNPGEVLDKYPHQLSGGMLQRIMIGIATSMEPVLLVADEPTTAIDAITQFEILDELVYIKERAGMAMVFISHDLNAISRVADRVVVLNQGLVVDGGDFEHILHHASDPYTRLLAEKRVDVMRRYCQVLQGKEE